ncbi:MAG TPA: hypothetical protein PK264_07405 [Hyphomicrobiaceae bacterium]|nr:hypothetical protein [Hyphomicrobiaceae bacterium]
MSKLTLRWSMLMAAALSAMPALAQRAEDPGALAEGRASTELTRNLNEQTFEIPVDISVAGRRTYRGPMVVTTFRPDGPGPFPLVIYLHGRGADSRHLPARIRSPRIAGYWARRGFAVVIPTRVGYGALREAPDLEDPGYCNDPDYTAMADALAATTVAVASWARTQAWAEKSRLIIAGSSVGGFGAVVASGRPPEGLLGVVNLAGGAGGRPRLRPGVPCATDRIAEFMTRAGTTARVPSIWVYAENDKFWGTEAPRRWHAAFTKAGGNAEFVMLPPSGEDGHRFATQSYRHWRQNIDRYLERMGIPTPRAKDAPAPSGFAEVEDAARVPLINEKARTEGYLKFLDADIPRAFAIGPSGAWAWSGGNPGAAERALERCSIHAKADCKLYAVDDAVVWQP